MRKSDEVVSAGIVNGDFRRNLLTISEKGFGKRTGLKQYRVQSRGGMGIKNMKITPKTGAVVGSVLVADTDELVLLSSNNKIIRIKVDEVRRAGRDTQGVKLVNLEGDQKVICFDIVVQENSLQKKED